MIINRRNFLSGSGASLIALSATSSFAKTIGGGINANSEGLRAGSTSDQGRQLQSILEKASSSNQAVFIEPGRYKISNLTLPKNTRLYGTSNATVFEYAGGDHFIYAENSNHVELEGIKLDGGLLPVKDYAQANLGIVNAKHVNIENCQITNSSQSGIETSKSAGRISKNRIDTAVGTAGIVGQSNTGMMISDNVVSECANAGILVYRRDVGEDNTMITNNRVKFISAVKGGTGQYGNGINTWQANGVMIANNHVSDCAYSTVRSNSCSNLQITNNTCLRAGETSIYSEFAFQGALISGNIVDGGARGISIANLDHGGRLTVCSNNLVRNIHENAPYPDDQHVFGTGILAEADIAITGNVIERTSRFGMLLGWGEYLRNVTASSNIIRDTKTGFYVSVVEGAGQVSISNNVVARASRGIVGYRWQEAVTGDMIKEGARNFANISLQGNRLA
jgi:uncharacterized secreted repeat protein (TIGR03808 family)